MKEQQCAHGTRIQMECHQCLFTSFVTISRLWSKAKDEAAFWKKIAEGKPNRRKRK